MGYGNPGRLDDGLGPALIERLEGSAPADVTLDANYQLQVEDAATVAAHETVVFVDAAVAGPEPYCFARVEPEPGVSFSSHSLRPGAVVAAAQDLFAATTDAYVLCIRGYEFDEFGEALSEGARANLEAAFEFMARLMATRAFEEAVTVPASHGDAP
jgi:hydrogenase maturation protease